MVSRVRCEDAEGKSFKFHRRCGGTMNGGRMWTQKVTRGRTHLTGHFGRVGKTKRLMNLASVTKLILIGSDCLWEKSASRGSAKCVGMVRDNAMEENDDRVVCVWKVDVK